MISAAPAQKTLLVVLGTRPEAIKLFPVIHALRAQPGVQVRVCATGQHGAMVHQILQLADIAPDYDLAVLQPGQSLDALLARLVQRLGRVSLVDARAGERYRGETEPLDTRAGHIPGAVNRFFKHNLQPDGRFKPVQALREDWLPLLQPGAPVVHQCGSGVTACHNLLALAHAGLGEGVLYPGSWSEWSADPSRPVALG